MVKCLRISMIIMRKENNDLPLIQYIQKKAFIIKSIWHLYKNRQVGQWNSPEFVELHGNLT